MKNSILKFGKKLVETAIALFGYSLVPLIQGAEGFPVYAKSAANLGMDINDYLEQKLDWGISRPVFEKLILPLVGNGRICEIGLGSGRWSRHFVNEMPNTVRELVLVEPSKWLCTFLQSYFNGNPNISILRGDGTSIPVQQSSWADLAFSSGVFIDINLGFYILYGSEFFRILKPGGYVALNYLDIDTPEGWNFFLTHPEMCNTFTYHSTGTVDKVFSHVGFHIIERHQTEKSMWIILQKPYGN
jgi:ubiquinone/menaquinone biosynthesis C-methylase UbiE